MLAEYTIWGFFGSNRTTGRSPPPIPSPGRGSSVVPLQLSPPSSDRYSFAIVFVRTAAKSVFGELGAIAMFACTTPGGRPFVNCRHVLPPSVDLKIPPPSPLKTPFSHGASQDSHSAA